MPAAVGPGWTEERVATLKTDWLDGASASQIARKLGYVTRSAVIGKIQRLGLSGADGSRARAAKPGERAGAARVKAAKPPPPVKPAERSVTIGESAARLLDRVAGLADAAKAINGIWPVPDTAIGMMRLGQGVCRWPVGMATGEHQLFCGAAAPEGRSYCAGCKARAYLPAKKVGPAYVRGLHRWMSQ